MPPKILYSRKDAAYVLSLSVDAICELVKRGLLHEIRKGRRFLLHRDELERFALEDTAEIWPPKQNGKTVRNSWAA